MAAPRPCGRLRGEGESSFLHPAGRWASRSPVGPVRGTDTGERRAGRRGAAPTTLTLAGDPLPALPCLRPARTQPRRGPVTFRARVPPLPPSRSGRCRGRRKGAGRPAPQRRAPPGRGEAADSPPTPRLTFRASPSSRKSAVSLKTATGGARGTAVKMEAAMAARRGPLRSAPLRSAPLRSRAAASAGPGLLGAGLGMLHAERSPLVSTLPSLAALRGLPRLEGPAGDAGPG